MSTEQLAELMLRATALLALSALTVQALSRWLRLVSPTVQRAAWFCVLLQGLMFVRFSLPVPYQATDPVAPNPSQATGLAAPAAEMPPAPDPAGLQRPMHEPQVAALAQHAEPSRSAAAAQTGWNWWNVMAVTWIAAIALLVSLAAIQYVRLAREVAATELMEAPWRSEWNALLAEHRIRRPIPLRATRDLGPALCLMPSGYQLLVPESAWQALPAAQRRAVLMHELAHYQRGDVWKSFIARALASVHWFNPCAWWAVRQFETYGELACDERAAADAGAAAYVRALLQLDGVQLRPAAFARPVTGGRLFMRVRRILSPMPPQDSIFKRTALVTVALALLVAASLRVEPLAAEPGGEPAGPQGADAEPAGAAQRLIDRYGDRLPEHALLRLGTLRLRHRNFILGTALSPDGALAASTAGNHDQGISIWETATGRLVRRLSAEDMAFGFTRPVAFSPDGARLLSGDGSGKVRMWDVATGRQLFSRAWHKEGFDGVTALAFSDGGDLFACAGGDGITQVGSTQDGRRIADFADFLAEVAAIAFSPDSKRLAVGRAGNPVRGYTGSAPPVLAPGSDQITVWSLDTRQPVANIGTAHDHLMSLFFTSDGEQLITSGNRTVPREEIGRSEGVKNVRVPEIRFWNLTTGKPVRRFFVRDAGYGQAVLSRDRQLLAAGYEGRLRLWDVASGKIRRTIEVEQWSGHRGLAISADGHVFAAPVHNSIGLWNAVTGDPLAPEFDSHASTIGAVAWLPGGRRIATGAEDGTVRLWDAKTGALDITLPIGVPYCLALSPNGSLLAAGGVTDPKQGIPGVHIWNTATGDLVRFSHSEDSQYQLLRAYRLAFAPDGTRLAVARDHLQKSNASDIDIWDVRAGQRLLRISTQFEGRVRTMKFSADSSQLYAVDERGPAGPAVASWDVATGQEGRRFSALIETQEPEVDEYGNETPPFVSDAAFTSDLKRLVTCQNRDIVIWDMATRKPLSSMRTPGTNKGRRIGLSADGRLLALAELNYAGDPGSDTIRIWDLEAEREVLVLEPDGVRAACFAFSPDGKRLVAGMDNGAALIWDLSTIQQK